MNDLKIVIDAGHGGVDSGASGNGLKEKDLTLMISKYLNDRFKELGVETKMTREIDETLTPNERINRILNSFGNDRNVLVLSNHINAGGGEGAEVIYALRNNDILSKNILNELTLSGASPRKAYQRRLPSDQTKDYYFIHRNTGMTEPLIIEYGFIDNAKDAKKIIENYKKYAEAVVKAVAQTKGIEYKKPIKLDRYRVQRGDTLWGIAKKLNTTVDKLKSANNLTSNLLYINQELIVPGYEIVEDSNINYVVKNNDTLYSISKQFNISIDEIKRINNLTSNLLPIGSLLKIPSSEKIKNIEDTQESVISEGIIYTVLPNDTLYSISIKNNISVNDIKKANNLLNDNIYTGMKLLLPNTSLVELYTVKKGDSLWSISKQFNISIDDIKSLNNLTKDIIIEGQKLQIKKNN